MRAKKTKTTIRVGNILKTRREELGLTKYRVSKDLGMSQSAYSNLEQGDAMSVRTLDRACNALGLQITLTPTNETIESN